MSDVNVIKRRLLERDGKHYGVNTLSLLQKTEKYHARYVARQLNIPMHSTSGMSDDSIVEDINFIKRIIEK